MRANASTTLLGRAALLVPYSAKHVEVYHSWMEEEKLREATASERLSLEEERENQRSWAEDDAKLTFIVCDATKPEKPAVGDVNLFFRERSPPPTENGKEGAPVSSSSPSPSSSSPSYLHETAEVEVMIADADSRGKGIAKEAVLLCLWWASAGAAAAESASASAKTEGGGAKAAPPPPPPPPAAIPRLRLARAKIGRGNAASLSLFGSALGFAKTGGSDFFEEDHFELELFENQSKTLCPLLARVGEYAVVGEVEREEDAAR